MGGWLRKPLKKGTELTIVIQSNFPVQELGAYKMLVLTTLSPLGGRHDGFGLFLLVCGLACLAVATLSLLIRQLCPQGTYAVYEEEDLSSMQLQEKRIAKHPFMRSGDFSEEVD